MQQKGLVLMWISFKRRPSSDSVGVVQTNTGAANVANAGGAVGGGAIPASQIRGRRLQQTGTGTRSGFTQGQGQGQGQAQPQAQAQAQNPGSGSGPGAGSRPGPAADAEPALPLAAVSSCLT